MTRIAVLPLDDRPVNYDYPRELAAIAGLEVDLPDRQALGNPWRSSQHQELIRWLAMTAKEADSLLIAIDTLGYGGLIPSRTSSDSADQVLERLSILKTLKGKRPELKILAFNVIMRISRDNSAEEEKPYWAQYGKRMFRISYLEHKSRLQEANQSEIDEFSFLHEQIPAEVYADYLKGRSRNHQINRTMLDWLGEGVFDYLILPQDDTADYGWNIAEARRLQAIIRIKGLSDRAITYPGADETGSLLLARYACQLTGIAPRVWPLYSSTSSDHIITSYEDRPMHEMLKAHLSPLGGTIAQSAEQADFHLFINAPAKSQGIAELQTLIAEELAHPDDRSTLLKDEYARNTLLEMTTPLRNIEEFTCAIRNALENGHPAALADVAFVNGADLFLLQNLLKTGLAPRLSAFAGWNTAGNTLGTALAQAALNLVRQVKDFSSSGKTAHLVFLFRRYLDDYYYQTLVRTLLAYQFLPTIGLQPTMELLPADKIPQVLNKLQDLLASKAEELKQQFIEIGLAQDIQVDKIHLPWQRLFEVGFDVHVFGVKK